MVEPVSRMADVAKLFGKKLEEPFDVSIAGEVKRYRCMFTDSGLQMWESDWQEWVSDGDEILHDLLVGGAFVHET